MKKIFLLNLLIISTLQLFSQTYNDIEAVEYDASQNRFFVSNGSSIIVRASNGDLSFFAQGSGASNGMEVLGDHLFVIDGTTIRGFELVSENEVMTLNISGASFLNGLTNDGVSTLYATDFSNKRIYKIDVADLTNPTFEIIVNNTVSTPNGIIFDGANNRLLFVNWGSNAAIKAIDLTDNSVSTIINTGFGNIDGIDEDNEGNYYISTWNPSQIAKYDSAFANAPEIITVPFIERPADIGYAKEIDTLAIPHYPNNGDDVAFVGFAPDTMTSAAHDIFSTDFELTVFPNPVSDHSTIRFSLEEKTPIQLNLWDQNGKLVKTLLEGNQVAGEHTISFQGINLPAGNYWLSLKSGFLQKTISISIR